MRRKFSLLLIVALIFNSISFSFAAITIKAPITLEKTIDLPRLENGNEFVMDNINSDGNIVTVNYTLTPNDIKKSDVPIDYPQKEIILVIDKSGSMKSNISGGTANWNNPSRMDITKEAAISFIDQLKDYPNVKVGLVEYSTLATEFKLGDQTLFMLGNNIEYSQLKNRINNINPTGGTNIGDGIRKAYNILNSGNHTEKFLVFLSDGEPSAFSCTDLKYSTNNSWGVGRYTTLSRMKYPTNLWNPTFYIGNGNAPQTYVNWSTTGDYGGYSLEYSKIMTRKLETGYDPISSYFIGFSDVVASNKLKQISDEITSTYKTALTADEIDTVYNDIATEIKADVKLRNVVFEEIVLPDLEVIESSLPEGTTLSGNKLTKWFDDIVYELNAAKTHYVASPITFSIQYKVTKSGTYNLGQSNSSKFTYTDINGDMTTNPFDVKTFTAKRLPVTGVTGERLANQNSNKISWDSYDGALGYYVYKDGNLVATVDNSKTSLVIPIVADDDDEADFSVVAIVSGDISEPGIVLNVDTEPSILNLTVYREGNKFILEWDKVDGATHYMITPLVNGAGTENSLAADDFEVNGNRVKYEYTAIGNYTVTDFIKFKVDGKKANSFVKHAISDEFILKEIVASAISDDVDDFVYSESSVVTVKFEAEGVPSGVYNPVFVIELNTSADAENKKLEYTHSIIEIYVGGNLVEGTVTRLDDERTIIYVTDLDYDGDGDVDTELQDVIIELKAEFGINFETVINTNILSGKVLTEIKKIPAYKFIEAWEIENSIEGILKGLYPTKYSTILEMKTYMAYNSTDGSVYSPLGRTNKVGFSSRTIILNNVEPIDNEF